MSKVYTFCWTTRPFEGRCWTPVGDGRISA